jgi:pimeloyl-ACP methyl ester carboxylesterase
MSTDLRKGYADTRFGQIHYRAAGSGSGLPLVLLHQTASDSVMYEPLMRALAAETRLIALDTPGFGGSFAFDGLPTVERWSESLNDALDALGVSACNLFGHHTGASIAAQIAVDRPDLVRALALSGPPYLSAEERARFLATAVYRITPSPDGAHLSAIWARIFAKEPGVPLALGEREALLTLQAGPRYAPAYEAVFSHDFASLLPRIACPTLLMAGEHDGLRAYVGPASRAMSNAQMRIIPDAGTYVCERQTEAVAALLRKFFTLTGI